MAAVNFRISDDTGDGLYYTVSVFDTREAAHAAYTRWVGHTQWEDGSGDAPEFRSNAFQNWNGLCCTRDIIQIDGNGAELWSPHLGRIFLSRSHLGVEVTVHEITHAVSGIWRRRTGRLAANNRASRVQFSSIESEERFCYSLGELYRNFMVKMYDRGLYVVAPDGSTEVEVVA